MEFLRVSSENRLWNGLIADWEDQCREFSEDLGEYAMASLPVLESLASETQRKNAGVFALRSDRGYEGICQLNVTPLPGYNGPVLRVRHIVHAPRYDFDNTLGVDEYGQVLTGTLLGVFRTSNGEMKAQHIKFHFKSPAEQMFFTRLKDALSEKEVFSSIELKGSWLYITK
ncbi:MAG: hypothetical protein BGP11_08580 [Rhodobacterales bacterium 65-51]|uniref:hypothetical protein n=1 Tax=uncultured Gemmobacter sp. TaxID=1095917 RepID=UPI0009699E3B|nr:hypothetical protein [uncultured Gemmobacter sp.]OJY34660.1 MAG: hypothetical protein BGP11_08580 [Rhodobacterales bacterium 65-51]